MPLGRLFFTAVLSIAAAPVSSVAAAPVPFDSTKYMRVSEVRPGMKGYGVSVFKGTTLQRFDVEVISVLKNFMPKDDVVLITCSGANLEHTGAIAGMSGSPIYLHDDAGHDRMIGAFAYGWPLVKDPIAGVQPIEYMLALPDYQKDSTTAPSSVQASAAQPQTQIHWSLCDALPMPGLKHMPKGYPLASMDRLEPNGDLLAESGSSQHLQPLATPLMTSGLSPKLAEQFAPLFKAYGLTLLQAGGGSSSPTTAPFDVSMHPGSVLAAPLLTGDADMTAVGTCTEVIGNRIFGFGHPFNSEGSINLPFGAGEINAIVAELTQSFKLGSITRTVGTLNTDQSVGVAGHLGVAPATMPIDLRIVYADGSLEQKYHFDCIIHNRFTPLLSVVALTAALTGQRELPENHAIDYDLNVKFNNDRSLHLANVLADENPASLFLQLAGPLSAAGSNPFAKVTPQRIDGTIRIISENRSADILSVNVAKQKYKPGETVTADIQYRPFRSGEATLPVDLQLPKDLPDGQYQLVVSGWERYVQDEIASRSFRFDADDIDEVFDVLADFESIRHDAVYMRLVRQADGVALGRTAMPRLPSSIRQVMLDAGRSDTTAFVSSDVQIHPTNLVLEGSAEFAITIEAPGHPEAKRSIPPQLPTPPMQNMPNGQRRTDIPQPAPMPPK